MSWLLPSKRSAKVSLPRGPSKVYSFCTFSQGRLWRSVVSFSRSFEDSFSFSSNFLRTASHSSWETTGCSVIRDASLVHQQYVTLPSGRGSVLTDAARCPTLRILCEKR